MEPKRYLNIHISTLTILKAIFILIAFYFLYLVRDILAVLFVSLVLASALGPSVDWMQKRRIPRPLGITFIYLALFIVVSSAVYLIIPPIIEQINDLSKNFPHYFEKIMERLMGFRDYALEYGFLDNIKGGLNAVSANLQTAAGGVFSTVTGIFGGIVSFFLVLVITFYMLVEKDAMRKIVWSVAPEQHQPYIIQLTGRMQTKIGLWLRGQLILSLIIFTLIFTGLKILGVKYALTLALIAGLTEFVPYLGPILAAIPAVFLSLTQSPMLALFVAVLYYIVQLVENHIIVPKVMQKVVGLNPVVSIIALLTGFKIAGVIGAVLSIPVTTAVSVFVKDIFEKKGVKEKIE